MSIEGQQRPTRTQCGVPLGRKRGKGNSQVRQALKTFTKSKTIARSNVVAAKKSSVIGETYIGFVLERYGSYWLAKGVRTDGKRISMVADSLSDLALRVATTAIQGEKREAINHSERKAREA